MSLSGTPAPVKTSTTPPKSARPVSEAAWQLIRDDQLDGILDDAALETLLAQRAMTSDEPHADILQLMLGTSLREGEARALFRRVLEHRRDLSQKLGRLVHVRVAALDLLTQPGARPSRTNRYAKRTPSVPIMVAPDLLAQALEEAGSDAVTGLPRGAHFMNLLQHQLLQRGHRLVVAYLDLDGFKAVNDRHGHAKGDEVLRALAVVAHSVLRRGDVLARLGGDEFGLMLVDATREEAELVVGRLRQRFEELTARLSTSFSAGLAVADGGLSAEELVARADAEMFEEKRARRGR